jgi:hypothetical protein
VDFVFIGVDVGFAYSSRKFCTALQKNFVAGIFLQRITRLHQGYGGQAADGTD